MRPIACSFRHLARKCASRRSEKAVTRQFLRCLSYSRVEGCVRGQIFEPRYLRVAGRWTRHQTGNMASLRVLRAAGRRVCTSALRMAASAPQTRRIAPMHSGPRFLATAAGDDAYTTVRSWRGVTCRRRACPCHRSRSIAPGCFGDLTTSLPQTDPHRRSRSRSGAPFRCAASVRVACRADVG